MSDGPEGTLSGPGHRTVELALAAFMALFALVVIGGSMQVGFQWAVDGPQAGFFPFYIGLFILGASIVNFWHTRTVVPRDQVFASWGQLTQVMSVVIPSAIYVVLVSWIGIYVSSMLLIGVFMKWLGRYGWPLVLLIAVGVPVMTFVVFERWFLVPLPKGPVEYWLGF
jgi:hypothetical protein